jgi:hypothetical protein
MYGPRPDSSEAEQALIGGTLERDGRCLYVVADDPALQRYPVLWPYGTVWQDEPEGVVLPDRTFVAVDAWFSSGGGYPSAGRLATGDLAEAVVERADHCAEGGYLEIAVVQSDVDVD